MKSKTTRRWQATTGTFIHFATPCIAFRPAQWPSRTDRAPTWPRRSWPRRLLLRRLVPRRAATSRAATGRAATCEAATGLAATSCPAPCLAVLCPPL